MSLTLIASLSAAGLFFGMLLLLEAGRRIGLARRARSPKTAQKGSGAVEGAIFGLLGLLIAFTFSGAASRFDYRRHLIAEEVNAIGTAYLRVDLLPADAQPEMRELFRRYIDSRLDVYKNPGDMVVVKEKLAQSAALQGMIWTKASVACQRPHVPAHTAILLLPALNQMIDITTTRIVATETHPPTVIFLLLGGLSLVSALLAGIGMSGSDVRRLLYMVVFAAIMSFAVYVILDLEYPRLGLIRIDAADQTLVELRKNMQ